MKIGTLHCTHCGEKHNGDISPSGEPIPCSSCDKNPVDLPTLMLALNIMDVTLKLCSSCKRSAPMHNAFCYHCGTKM
ncbi:MAG: hypothetical protein HN576_05740 [Bacteriovoracaceae bacterium]|jgi:hypothetical protein|nr:hypothetical protein [Bacteriovoracaceae bacterium]